MLYLKQMIFLHILRTGLIRKHFFFILLLLILSTHWHLNPYMLCLYRKLKGFILQVLIGPLCLSHNCLNSCLPQDVSYSITSSIFLLITSSLLPLFCITCHHKKYAMLKISTLSHLCPIPSQTPFTILFLISASSSFFFLYLEIQYIILS